eukprot:g7936.t1
MRRFPVSSDDADLSEEIREHSMMLAKLQAELRKTNEEQAAKDAELQRLAVENTRLAELLAASTQSAGWELGAGTPCSGGANNGRCGTSLATKLSATAVTDVGSNTASPMDTSQSLSLEERRKGEPPGWILY